MSQKPKPEVRPMPEKPPIPSALPPDLDWLRGLVEYQIARVDHMTDHFNQRIDHISDRQDKTLYALITLIMAVAVLIVGVYTR